MGFFTNCPFQKNKTSNTTVDHHTRFESVCQRCFSRKISRHTYCHIGSLAWHIYFHHGILGEKTHSPLENCSLFRVDGRWSWPRFAFAWEKGFRGILGAVLADLLQDWIDSKPRTAEVSGKVRGFFDSTTNSHLFVQKLFYVFFGSLYLYYRMWYGGFQCFQAVLQD